MTPLPEVARACGYTIVSNRSQTVMELEGTGNWDVFELACRQFVKRTHNGHSYDHVSVIYRHREGKRTLLDVGVNGTLYGELPAVGATWARKHAQGSWGVRKMCHRYVCQLTAHGVRVYLGMFATAEEAARARDRYVIEQGLNVSLNYPEAVTA
jgi:hypothetical protein